MVRKRILKLFPNLDPSVSDETSLPTNRYNCIAYAAGDDRRWWWPDPDGIDYWPEKAQRVVHLAAFQHAFETLGYSLASDEVLEEGYEKVAVFSVGAKPTHAARQLANGLWSSKLGNLEDISHNLNGVENKTYGTIAFFMKRPI